MTGLELCVEALLRRCIAIESDEFVSPIQDLERLHLAQIIANLYSRAGSRFHMVMSHAKILVMESVRNSRRTLHSVICAA